MSPPKASVIPALTRQVEQTLSASSLLSPQNPLKAVPRSTVFTAESSSLSRNTTAAPRGVRAQLPNSATAKSPNIRTAKRATKAAGRSSVAKQRVLVGDDVIDVTDMIALFLKHAGYEVSTANSANNALQLAAVQIFDLIISDIGMPEMNGYELAENLRGQNDYRTTPLIAVTGYTEYDDRGRSLRAGFDAHLTKPINPSQL